MPDRRSRIYLIGIARTGHQSTHFIVIEKKSSVGGRWATQVGLPVVRCEPTALIVKFSFKRKGYWKDDGQSNGRCIGWRKMEKTNITGKMPVLLCMKMGRLQVTNRFLFVLVPNDMVQALQEENLKDQGRQKECSNRRICVIFFRHAEW